MGITKEGDLVEEMGFQITGYREPEVEYKSVDKDCREQTKTINQARAIHLVPLVAYLHPL